MSQLPMLAPRPPGDVLAIHEKPRCREHTGEEWEAKRETIEQLYIRENRRLVNTMAIMASKHGFAATEQMYKKRLKKWNVRKRAYRNTPEGSVASTPASAASASGCATRKSRVQHMHAATTIARNTRVNQYTGLEAVLDSVRAWSLGKLEAQNVPHDPMVDYLANPTLPPIRDSRTMYRTFELVFDLWYYGKGRLAGMAARKAFYMLEFVLMHDHPDLVWHILDTVYDMVDKGHIQLLRMFLAHASELCASRLPHGHPLVRILQQLIRCDYRSPQGRQSVCHLLQTAWMRNVDILGDCIESRAAQNLWLYEQLIWDGRSRLRRVCNLAARAGVMTAALSSLNQRRNQDATVPDLDDLRIMALTLEYTQMDLVDRQKAEDLAWGLLRLTAQGMGESRSSARFHAYGRKMLARLQEHRQEWAQAEGNLRFAVERREAAHGAHSDLRVIRDMWVLAGHYQRAGRDGEAHQTVQDAISRAETFLGAGDRKSVV